MREGGREEGYALMQDHSLINLVCSCLGGVFFLFFSFSLYDSDAGYLELTRN